jgi:uncharacterized protein (TIGR00369 family)
MAAVSEFQPRNPEFRDAVRGTFAAQPFMLFLGASLTKVDAGSVEITLPIRNELSQQQGSVHAGVTAALADTACGLAAQTLMEAGNDVLSVEFKLNLLEPAAGRTVVAHARVIRSGRSLTVCQADVMADGVLVATMLGTMIARRKR